METAGGDHRWRPPKARLLGLVLPRARRARRWCHTVLLEPVPRSVFVVVREDGRFKESHSVDREAMAQQLRDLREHAG